MDIAPRRASYAPTPEPRHPSQPSAVAAMEVREAPVLPDQPASQTIVKQDVPNPTDNLPQEKSTPAKENGQVANKVQSYEKPLKVSTTPVGAIMVTLFVMFGLMALAVWVYIQSNN